MSIAENVGSSDLTYESIEYWKPHFDEEAQVSLDYSKTDDNVRILTVTAKCSEPILDTPILVIAGWFSQITGWTEVTKELSKYTTVYYLETREKSSSILPENKVDMSVPRMKSDLPYIAQNLGFEMQDIAVLGSSMGGTIMLDYLSTVEQQPKLAVLIGPNPEFHAPKWLLRWVLYLPTFIVNPLKWAIKWYIRTFMIDMKSEPKQYEKYAGVLDNARPWNIKHSARECLWYEAWDKLHSAEISSKVILVGASSDKMHDAEQTMKVHEIIEGSEYVDFPTNKSTHSSNMGKFVIDQIRELEAEATL